VTRHVEFDREKFEQLILYIARRLPPEAALGRVKLAKLLMLSDFTAFARLGVPITGATYEKWEHGHLPTELLGAENSLMERGNLDQRTVDYYGKELKHTTALANPNMAAFTEDELAIVEGVLRQYGHESAAYLSYLSHQELGWQLAKDHETIPYHTVFLSKTGPSQWDLRRGEELASLHGWN
jgi:uncharacterized phage-associated protein